MCFPKYISHTAQLICLALIAVKNYDFMIVNTGVDKRSTMLRSKPQRRSSAALHQPQHEQLSDTAGDSQSLSSEKQIDSEVSPSNAMPAATHEPAPAMPKAEIDVNSISSSMSALKFVPPSIRFGRGGRRGGLSRS